MTPIRIRRLTPHDPADLLDRAGAIVQTAYLSIPDYPPDPEYDAQLARVPERVADSWVMAAFAPADDRVHDDAGHAEHLVGCLTFVPSHDHPHSDHDDPGATTFRFFGVAPEAQGRRVGDALVRWCLDETRRLGRSRVRIHTIAEMRSAIRLYERYGFVRDPAEDMIADDGTPLIAYVLHLDT